MYDLIGGCCETFDCSGICVKNYLHFTDLYARISNVLADVAEWQTQQTQNLPVVTSCGFKSRHPHHVARNRTEVVQVSRLLFYSSVLIKLLTYGRAPERTSS